MVIGVVGGVGGGVLMGGGGGGFGPISSSFLFLLTCLNSTNGTFLFSKLTELICVVSTLFIYILKNIKYE
jgi:hypothetical protein